MTSVVASSLLGVVAPAAHAAEPGIVTDVRLSRSSVAVSSLNTVAVTVEMDAKFPGQSPDATYHVGLERIGGSGQLNSLDTAEMKRYEGTVANGKYRGVLHVPSTANGSFRVTGVVDHGTLVTGEGEGWDVTGGPQLAVTGTNQPRTTAKGINEPSPVSKPYTIRWSVINGQTGKPYGSRIKVNLGQDTACGWGTPRVTDTAGYVTATYPATNVVPLTCLTIPGDPFPIAYGTARPKRIPGVSATPARTSAPVGTKVAVNGNVTGGADRCKVHLQRLYGASQWRTVGSVQVRDTSNRFTLTAQPAYKGNIPYRVLFTACNDLVTATSKSFTIRGT